MGQEQQLPGAEREGDDRSALDELYDSTFSLVSSWTARTVTQLLYARAGISMGPGQHVVLRQAHRAGPLKLGRLAALTGMTASNASKVVTDLVDTGLVRRQVPDDDRRVTLLQVTDEGRRVLAHLERTGGEMLGERLTSFAPEEVDDLRRLLGRLADEVESWGAQLVEGGDGDNRGGTAARPVEES